MAKTPAENIAEFLQTSGVGTLGTDIFVGHLPQGDDLKDTTIIGVFDTGAIFSSPRYQRDEVTFKVAVRAPETAIDPQAYKTGYNKCLDIRGVLLGAANQTLDTATYTAFNQVGGITYLGQDARNRPIFEIGYRVTIDNQPNDNRIAL